MKSRVAKPTRSEWPEQDSVKQHDWRLHTVTAIGDDGGAYRRGDVIKAAFSLELSDGSAVQAGVPNIEALLLDLAARFDNESRAELIKLDRDQSLFASDAALFEIL